MARIILTGASGLTGHEVVRRFATAGDEVICLGRRPADFTHEAVEFIAADLTQPLPIAALPQRADAVVHLAQCERFGEFPEAASSVFAVNVAAPVALLDWARTARVGAFAHASSGGLYGGGPSPLTEADPVKIEGPLAHYLSTKRATEMLAESYREVFAVTALRFFFVYGPRQRAGMLLPRLIRNVREGQALTLRGPHGMRLNPVFVTDAAAAVLAAIRRKTSGLINVAGPDVVSIRDIGEAIGRHVGKTPLFQQETGDPRHLVADLTRMRAELGAPETDFVSGMRQMCA